tara:strand:+ start:3701 stop:3916 length:216 start_codon:yes stop_codon:yes gene_type:complete
MGLLKSLRRSLHKKRTLKLKMKGGGGCGGGNQQADAFTGSTFASNAHPLYGGRRRRRTGRRRSRGGSRRRR